MGCVAVGMVLFICGCAGGRGDDDLYRSTDEEKV